MTQREKLIELIMVSVGGCARHWAEVIADYLLANGVVVLKDESAPPCRACNHGWGSASADGIKTCKESCLELREYTKREGGDE